ncbi:hypothetical protein UFOVP1470_21 [uncultured Caudovirales phage]|uniref:Uncharacterized protein n=1 Tax=uncultured Caudovirales phage TaxID=2100421 RepID=A0A6J5S287_9CAUD|nr:hypothetical protein UFOVP939_5 [uncultured Caudovirales phage]CAB4178563.1 hypothetical protein UFOVP1018_19 [uncultured Caudovirales phage]CAB4183964.1 hypothetical protein UFOVP1105_20 [uncultured Caudovirales phage]CAB4202386.1 hypothetical protein UFOVP1372_10 [uncultured Caudovirales phage]CAB4215004.1 hypothetical protein UFOVP1470_21 [uncultured Caudovirales phage]
MKSRQELYALLEPFGDSATCKKPGGRIYGGGGSSGGSSTTASIDKRFSPLIDYATQAGAAVNNAGFTPYTGQRYEGMNQYQNMGMGMIGDRALNGDPTMQQANSTLQDTLRAGNTNPYLDSMVKKATMGVAGNLAGINASSGSFGNSGIQEVGARQMGDIASQMYGNAYEGDQSRKMQALQMAPGYGNQAYTDASQLMKVGGQVQDLAQQNRDFGYQQFADQQNLPYKQMGAYGGLLSAQPTQNSTTTQSGGGK